MIMVVRLIILLYECELIFLDLLETGGFFFNQRYKDKSRKANLGTRNWILKLASITKDVFSSVDFKL